MNLFVSLDGVDGVGKTTVAKLLAADGMFYYFKSPSGPFSELRKEVDEHASPLERYCFYRLATQYDSLQIERILVNSSVVCDRYIASTLAYHVGMDARIWEIHNERGILKPNFSFLLWASSLVRHRRIQARALVRSDHAIEKNTKFLDRVESIFLGFDGLIHIDTSSIGPKEVVDSIYGIINQGRVT